MFGTSSSSSSSSGGGAASSSSAAAAGSAEQPRQQHMHHLTKVQPWVEKHRPQGVEDIAHQDETVKTLKNAIQTVRVLIVGGWSCLARAGYTHTRKGQNE
jgi:hypothetical protein